MLIYLNGLSTAEIVSIWSWFFTISIFNSFELTNKFLSLGNLEFPFIYICYIILYFILISSMFYKQESPSILFKLFPFRFRNLIDLILGLSSNESLNYEKSVSKIAISFNSSSSSYTFFSFKSPLLIFNLSSN